jgi:hypothetical protein
LLALKLSQDHKKEFKCKSNCIFRLTSFIVLESDVESEITPGSTLGRAEVLFGRLELYTELLRAVFRTESEVTPGSTLDRPKNSATGSFLALKMGLLPQRVSRPPQKLSIMICSSGRP